MLTGDALLAKVKELGNEQMTESKEITITKQQLDKLWNALEYTRATINNSYVFPSMEGKLDYKLIHSGRAFQSGAYLDAAIKLVNELKGQLK